MFRFLSFFRKANDEALAENDYDFNEFPAPVKDISEVVDNQLSGPNTATTIEQQRPPLERRPIVDRAQEPARIEQITKLLRDLSDNSADKRITNDHTKMAETTNTVPLVPDLSLIHGYGHPEDEGQEIPVGITRFQRGKKVFDFVTGGEDHAGKIQDAAHRIIHQAIVIGSPQVVITEGHTTDMPEEVKNGIIEETKREVEKVQNNNNVKDPPYIPEAGYAAYLAAEHGINSVGGEMSGSEFVAKMQARGYTAEDVLAVQFMRQLQTLSHDDSATMTDEEFVTNHAQRLLDEANNLVNPQQLTNIEALTLDRFKKWYDTTRPLGDRSFLSVDDDDFEPHQQGAYLNKMACVSGHVRDEYLAKLLGDLVNQNDHVIIVYGGGHLTSLRPLIEDMFDDKGTFSKLVDEETPPQQAA